MQKRIISRWLTAGVAALALCTGCIGAGLLKKTHAAYAASAAENATALLGKDGSATGLSTAKKLPLSPWNDGSYSYQFRAQQLEYRFAPAIDASWAQQTTENGFAVKDNVYLEFWIFSTRAQNESAWSGDNQIEIASRTDAGHDYEEYHWRFTDIIFERGYNGANPYVSGKWNRVRLKLTPESGEGTAAVDLGRISFLRMYYLFDTVTYTEPVFVSDVKLVTGTDDTLGVIREYRDASEVAFPDTLPMPEDKTEGDVVTLPVPTVKDLDGKNIPESKVSVTTIGPNGFEMQGRTVELQDGDGDYTTRYAVTDLMGNVTVREYTFRVAKAPTDRYAPKILVKDTMPADFMVKADASYRVSDYVTVADNYGYKALRVEADITDDAGVSVASFRKAADEDKAWSLDFAPERNVVYNLHITATDASGQTTSKDITLATYLPPQTDRVVRLFEGDDLYMMSGNYYSGRLVDAVPQDGQGTTASFHYKGGATSTTDNEAFRQEMVLVNNSPADVSSIDLRWAAIRLNIYIDVRYINDDAWMPSNGTGYGNMGIGFSSSVGIYDTPRIEYSVNDLHLQAGWNEVTIKLGRAFNGTVDYSALCEMYVYSNFGSARHMLFNDVRMIETDAFGEGFPSATDTTTYVSSTLISKASDIEDAHAELDEGGIYRWQDKRYAGNQFKLPGLVVTDAMNKSDVIERPDVIVTAPDGTQTQSIYFTPTDVGTYTVLYSATDWYGKPVSLTKTFEVLPWNAMPIIKTEQVENDLGDMTDVVYECRVGKSFTIPSLDISDPQGERVEVAYYVTAPDGKSVALNANGKSFATTLPGDYIVTIVATDAVGQVATADLVVKSYDVTQSVYRENNAAVGWIIGGSVGGAVVLCGAAVGVWLILRRKKTQVGAQTAVDEATDETSEK